jgi:hypothetical protein
MSAELDRAAAAWDRAARDKTLNPPAPADTRPVNSLYNRPVPINIKFTIGKGVLHSPYPKS